MTSEEARRILMSDADFSGTGEKAKLTADALCVAVDALKKQVPMKPEVGIIKKDLWKDDEDDPIMLEITKKLFPERYIGCKYYFCPDCGCSVENRGLKDDYCSHCGQRVDWSEEEE